MAWDRDRWDRYLRKVRSALVKRDTLIRGETPCGREGRESELVRQRSAWASEAKAYLRALAMLARQAPDASRAGETVHELNRWYEDPAH